MNKLIQDYLNKEASENPEFSVKLAKWKPEQIWDAITKKVRTMGSGNCVCLEDDIVYRIAKDIINDQKPKAELVKVEKRASSGEKVTYDIEKKGESEEEEKAVEEGRKEQDRLKEARREAEARKKAGVSKDQLSIFEV